MDQEAFDQGIRLTAVGISAAFGVLLLLTLIIAFMGRAASFVSRRFSKADGSASDQDRALAAVVAVSAMRERDGGPTAGRGESDFHG